MGWEDRRYGAADSTGGRPGGDWRGLMPRLDNPMSWSVPFGRVFGISIRVHVFLLLFIIAQLLRSGLTEMGTATDLAIMSVLMVSLFLIVLLHEFGHCFACRATGGDADEILMWPLGGLAYCQPPHRWLANLITVLGGPMVNVVLIPVFGLPLLFTTGVLGGVALPNPFSLFSADAWSVVGGSWFAITLYSMAAVNLILLLFNLLPMFPLDGGRIVQSSLWPLVGYGRSMRYAVMTGYVGAALLFVFAIIREDIMLICIALFGGFTCWQTYRQLQFSESMMGYQDADAGWSGGADEEDDPRAARRALKEQKRREKAEAQARRDEAELDRLLEKIKQNGMDSLSSREQRWLRQQSQQKKKGR